MHRSYIFNKSKKIFYVICFLEEILLSHLTAGHLKQQGALERLVHLDEGYKLLRALRGSPPYFEKAKKDIFAMIRQLGPATLFCSFSSAEMPYFYMASGHALLCSVVFLVVQSTLFNFCTQKLSCAHNHKVNYSANHLVKSVWFEPSYVFVNLVTSMAVTGDLKAREISLRLEGFPRERKRDLKTTFQLGNPGQLIKLVNAAGILMQAGDISLNPGPVNHAKRPLCSLCLKTIRRNQGEA